jgi:hypothetical protein
VKRFVPRVERYEHSRENPCALGGSAAQACNDQSQIDAKFPGLRDLTSRRRIVDELTGEFLLCFGHWLLAATAKGLARPFNLLAEAAAIILTS